MAEDTEQQEEQPQASADEEQKEDRRERMRELEEGDPPKDLKDWPDDDLKYETFGGPEGDHSYEEGPEAKLGPSGLRHKEGGAVEIEGEEVDDPEEYKGDPIPGGPTDPNATGPDVDNNSDDESDDEDEREGEDDDEKGDGED